MNTPSARQNSGLQWRAGGGQVIDRATPCESPAGLSYNGRPHTVLMASPDDLADLAIGFTLTEAIADLADILDVVVESSPLGTLIDIRLAKTRIKARPRGLEGRSSCGLCGVQRLADVVRPLPTVGDGVVVEHRAITRALATMEARQTLGQLTRATHAAAFARTDGTITHLREDVGRHNALDKLAGALARDGVEAGQGFILVTSRCSFEMVEKAARIGCPILVAVSAPTDLAIRKAEESGLTLVALARADGHTIFSRPDRLVEVASAAVA